LLELANDFVVVESAFDQLTPRNRDVRIQLRNVLEGDFLYVDGDTIFLRSPAPGMFTGPIGAVPDCNQRQAGGCGHGRFIREVLHDLQWGLPVRQYNGGVLFFADDPRSTAFCEQWRSNWLTLLERLERYRHDAAMQSQAMLQDVDAASHVADQLAFDYTASVAPAGVSVGSNRCNVMVPTSAHLVRDATILHFFSAPQQIAGTLLEHLLDHLDRTGQYDATAVAECRRGGHPWGPRPEAWQYARSGHYVKAILRKLTIAT
jgi:hypothetical protein